MSELFTAENMHTAQWRDRLQDAVDQALSPSEALQVHAHLATCPTCAQVHRRLLTIDASLRNQFAVTAVPSIDFDQTVFAAIAAHEADKRATARQQELQEHAARVEHWRNRWQELTRFHLGSIIGGMVTVAVIVSAWPSMSKDLVGTGTQAISWLPGVNSLLPTGLIALAALAFVPIWITRRLDNR
jgi:anti-sigma factor RsiW